VTLRKPVIGVAGALALVAGACGGPGRPSGTPVTLGEGKGAEQESAPAQPETRRVDPRKGGFEVGFGEFAVTLEAAAIRPGPVTFEIHNGGKLVHGFEMEAEAANEDNSGPGSGGEDGFKIELNTFEPGATLRTRLDLATGVYKIECFVANHDDRGMEILLDVRPGAPLVRQEAAGDAVAIEGFAFDPQTIEVPTGTEVTWTNADPEAHTVTADDDSFDSGPIDPGKDFSVAVDATGTVTYFCAIHPTMKGSLQVTG
jgi:plastocyanin